MKITWLGHAGFYVESDASVIIMDPWLSPYGAFDSSWFQYPSNHHLADVVCQQFETTSKDKYIYISHEHKDHFDMDFLNTLKKRNFKFILANFQRSIVKESLLANHYDCEGIISLDYDESYPLQDGNLRLFVFDAELDCDSAILLKTGNKSFLNINDCKLHEKLKKINDLYGPVDAFAAQFSGAIWHPVCYDLPEKEYERISIKKKMNKFSMVSQALETLNPDIYFASAGPPCFLDPELMHINFEKINIFPRAPEFLRYLERRCKAVNTLKPELMPGDMFDLKTNQFISKVEEEKRVHDSEFPLYVHNYAKEYQTYFHKRKRDHAKVDPETVFHALKTDLQQKMNQVDLGSIKVSTILYWRITGWPEMYRIDLNTKSIEVTPKLQDPEHYWMIEAPAWQVNKVLSGEMNWPDFVLTFRVRLFRNPDLYDIVTHGFIAIDTCEIARFCELVKKFHANSEDRIVVEWEGRKYSVQRWCPHMGGDLSAGWIENGCLVCPRHQWHFDLEKQGQCTTSTESIHAIPLDATGKKDPDCQL